MHKGNGLLLAILVTQADAKYRSSMHPTYHPRAPTKMCMYVCMYVVKTHTSRPTMLPVHWVQILPFSWSKEPVPSVSVQMYCAGR